MPISIPIKAVALIITKLTMRKLIICKLVLRLITEDILFSSGKDQSIPNDYQYVHSKSCYVPTSRFVRVFFAQNKTRRKIYVRGLKQIITHHETYDDSLTLPFKSRFYDEQNIIFSKKLHLDRENIIPVLTSHLAGRQYTILNSSLP